MTLTGEYGPAVQPFSGCGDLTLTNSLILTNDLTVQGDFTFGNASTDSLTVHGQQSNTASRSDVTTGYEKYILLEGTLDSTGSAGGVKTRGIDIDLERPTAVVANGDSRDQALKISIKNEVAGHAAGYFIRGIDCQAKQDVSGGTISAIYGANITAYNDTGTVLEAYALRLGMKNDGTATNSFYGLYIQDESQGTNNGVHYGIYLTTANYNPGGGRDAAMFIDSMNTTGWTNGIDFNGVMTSSIAISDVPTYFLDLSGCTGTNATITSDSGSAATTWKARIKVKTDDGTDAWVNCYSTSNEA